MTEIQKAGPRDPRSIERVLLQQAVMRELKKFADDEKQAVHDVLGPGESVRVFNERGGHLGTITRNAPKQRAVIVDPSVVLAEAQASGAELEDRLPEYGSPQYWEAVDVLLAHAPHLVQVNLLEQEEERLAEEVLAEYHRSGAVAEGWRISDGSGGYTSVRTSTLGKEVAGRMVSQARGVLELEKGNSDE